MKKWIVILALLFVCNVGFAAQIVCIDTGTYHNGINNIGDIVAIHEDDVNLSSAYSTFKVIQIVGITKLEVLEKLPISTVNKISKYSCQIILTKQETDALSSDLVSRAEKYIILNKLVANE